MGQKIHPGGLRVGVIHDWKSNWYTGKKEFADYILEDVRIREHIYNKLAHAGLSDILIRKDKQRITVDIYTARPGIVIGKSGVEVDALRRELHALTQKNVHININEIKRPELDAKLVAQSIAEQLSNRVAFRRAMKRALASRDPLRRRRREDPVLGPPRRRRDEPARDVQRGSRPAAHDPRRHRLRLRRGEDDRRPDRRQGLDQQGRDHAARASGETDTRLGDQDTRRRRGGALEGLGASRESGRSSGQDREGLGPVRQRRRGQGGGGGGPGRRRPGAVPVAGARRRARVAQARHRRRPRRERPSAADESRRVEPPRGRAARWREPAVEHPSAGRERRQPRRSPGRTRSPKRSRSRSGHAKPKAERRREG